MNFPFRIPVLAGAALVLAYSIWVVLSRYYSGAFGYHDLALINEFLSSTAHGGGLFRVAQGNYSHFEVHFTPTLFLLLPFYWLSDSQSLLLLLNAFALVATGLIYLRVVDALSLLYGDGERKFPRWGLFALFLFFTLSRFPKNDLMAASCWFLYPPLAGMAILSLLREKNLWVTIAWSLLALGVRQDTGLFLACQFALVAGLPLRSNPLRTRALTLAGLAFAYTLVFALWLGPAFGMTSHVHRGWSRYGSSWGEIMRTAIGSPLLVWGDLKTSAFLRLNLSFGGLPLLNPLAFVWANLPGGLFYLCDDPAKKYLWYYNSTFLLPGIFIAFALGGLKIIGTKTGRWIFGLSIPILLLTLSDHDMLRMTPATDFAQTRSIRQAIRETLADCPRVRSIASDFRSIVFFPSHFPKYLLDKFAHADLVVWDAQYEVGLPGQPDAHAEEALRAAGYAWRPSPSGTRAFVKTSGLCEPRALN